VAPSEWRHAARLEGGKDALRRRYAGLRGPARGRCSRCARKPGRGADGHAQPHADSDAVPASPCLAPECMKGPPSTLRFEFVPMDPVAFLVLFPIAVEFVWSGSDITVEMEVPADIPVIGQAPSPTPLASATPKPLTTLSTPTAAPTATPVQLPAAGGSLPAPSCANRCWPGTGDAGSHHRACACQTEGIEGGSESGLGPPYLPRFDINANGLMNLSDVVLFGPVFNQACN
jgi:hypothetical protein